MNSRLLEDSFYSNPRYLLGDDAVHELLHAKCFLAGLGGLGAEIAKNLVLTGVYSLTLQDNKEASVEDLGANFLLTSNDVAQKKNRAEACSLRLAELNPHVRITSLTLYLDNNSELEFLKQYQCVILTELPLELQIQINNFCRNQEIPIKYISADVYGAFSWIFCDFGNEFKVTDPDGEVSKDVFIKYISKDNPGVVTCSEDKKHGFEDDDIVLFSHIRGMSALNDKQIKIQKLDDHSFTICNTVSSIFHQYTGGGIIKKIKQPSVINFKPLKDELHDPHITKIEQGITECSETNHVGMMALHSFWETYHRLPDPWNTEDAQQFVLIAERLNLQHLKKPFSINQEALKKLAFTAKGFLPPLITLIGGIAAQEALKALTNKLMPIRQWLYFDCQELISSENKSKNSSEDNSRYSGIEICLEQKLSKLFDANLLLIGCSAVAYEILKTCALLGVSTNNGKIIIADDDIVKKSNLNNQFLFKSHHLQNFKSVVAAEAVKLINNDINIEAHQRKVFPQTADIYNETLFTQQDVILTALDNMESRRFVDTLCVKYCSSLIDSGTAGTKGHVQVILPHVTENFSRQSDPVEQDFPYCTLKYFPSTVEHVVQWAKEKFENLFSIKPTLFNNFWITHPNIDDLLQQIEGDHPIDYNLIITKYLKCRPVCWRDCIVIARLKFEKYFNHKAKHLLHLFPLDTKLCNGNPFWQAPKFPPVPLQFDSGNEVHLNFIMETACLFAKSFGISYSPEELEIKHILEILYTIPIPNYIPNDKQIIIDENATKPEIEDIRDNPDPYELAKEIRLLINNGKRLPDEIKMFPIKFEKDDFNGHLKFIYATVNLRAAMYNIEIENQLHVYMIARHLIPSYPTTTAVIAGFVGIEMLKLFCNIPREKHQNCFLNLALPMLILCTPLSAQRTKIGDNLSFTLWDKWYVNGKPEFTLQDFIKELEEKTHLKITLIVHGKRMIYVPILPGYTSRHKEKMISLIKLDNYKDDVELFVAYKGENDEIMGPPVRYNFGV